MEIVRLNEENGIGADRLYEAVFEIEKQWHPGMADDTVFLRAYAEKIYNNALVFGAMDGDEIIGLAAVYANDLSNQQAYLTYIALREEYSSHGLGTKLLTLCENTARERHMTGMRLEVKKANIRAINFYRKSGYATENESADGISFFMKKSL